MSTAASSASPAIIRSHSSSRSNPSYAPPSADIPHRTRSTATKQSSTSNNPHRTNSRTHSYDRAPPSNPAALANVARRDFETTDVARPSSSRRSSSRDRPYDAPPAAYRTESTRSHHRTSSRHRHNRDSSDMSGATTVVANAGSTPVQPPAAAGNERPAPTSHPSPARRRTTITAQTGQWALGKTIGAGSMGKVKLAKNLETGEQVRQQS